MPTVCWKVATTPLENGELLLAELVAVAVMTWPRVTGTSGLMERGPNETLPEPLVVTLIDPKKSRPWLGLSVRLLAKNWIVNAVFAGPVSVPARFVICTTVEP